MHFMSWQVLPPGFSFFFFLFPSFLALEDRATLLQSCQSPATPSNCRQHDHSILSLSIPHPFLIGWGNRANTKLFFLQNLFRTFCYFFLHPFGAFFLRWTRSESCGPRGPVTRKFQITCGLGFFLAATCVTSHYYATGSVTGL